MRGRNLALVVLLTAGCAGGGSTPTAGPQTVRAPLILLDMKGRTHDLEAGLERGETVALVFWQTWCKSCRREAPQLVQAARDHGERIRFVGVIPGRDDTVDDAEVKRTSEAWGYAAFPQVRDRDLSLTRGLEVEGTPTIVVLGKDEKELFRGHRAPESWADLRGVQLAPERGAE